MKIRKENTYIFRIQSEVNCLIEQRYDKNYRQPLYSKRPHDLLAKEKRQENIFSIRTTNPPKNTLHARQNERVSDESETGKCLVGTPNSLFSYFNTKDNQVLWKAWVRACQLLTVFSVLLHNQWTTIETYY